MTKFEKFLTYLAMAPKIIETVVTIEKVVPIPGLGGKKLDLILGFVEEASKDISELPLAELKDKVTEIVKETVTFLNDSGVFKKQDEA